MLQKKGCGKAVELENISPEFERKLKNYLAKGSTALGIQIEDGCLDQFIFYLKLMMYYQEKMNLSSITDPFDIIDKHFLDSISGIRLVSSIIAEFNEKKQINMIDIGSGAGFPGIPIKIILPEKRMTLLEARKNKKSFLDKVVESLKLKKTLVIQDRAESIGRMEHHREKYHIVLSRSVANLGILSEYCLPLCRNQGAMIAFKGSSYKEEIDLNDHVIKKLGGHLESIHLIKIPRTDYKRPILIIRKVGLTPEGFPRRIGIPQKRPLCF